MGEMFPQVKVIPKRGEGIGKLPIVMPPGPGEDEHKKAAPKSGLLKWPY